MSPFPQSAFENPADQAGPAAPADAAASSAGRLVSPASAAAASTSSTTATTAAAAAAAKAATRRRWTANTRLATARHCGFPRCARRDEPTRWRGCWCKRYARVVARRTAAARCTSLDWRASHPIAGSSRQLERCVDAAQHDRLEDSAGCSAVRAFPRFQRATCD